MKNYHEYEKISLGYSDIAALTVVGLNEEKSRSEYAAIAPECLSFREDGNYEAYLVDEDAEIGEHYTLVLTFTNWIKIYDDAGLVYKSEHCKEIKIYRSGSFGCIIQCIK